MFGGQEQIEVHVLVVGEPFRSRAEQYRTELVAFHSAWSEFAESKGAQGFASVMGGYRPPYLCMKNASAPEGWTKPKGPLGMSRPKKGSRSDSNANADFETMMALPAKPRSSEIFGDQLIQDVRWVGSDGSHGASGIGYRWEPGIGWLNAGDEIYFIAVIPHAARAAQDKLAELQRGGFSSAQCDYRITNGALDWTLPEGLVELSLQEQELLFATHNAGQEVRPLVEKFIERAKNAPAAKEQAA